MLSGREDSSAVRYTILDGSFVEDKPDPEDVDVLLVVEQLHDGSVEESIATFVAGRQLAIKARYLTHAFVVDQGAAVDWIRFFSQRRDGRRKGTVRLEGLIE